MKNSLIFSKLPALVLASLLFAVPLQSATHFVFVDGSGFSPSLLNINTGDTVVWVNDDEDFSHTTTSTLHFLNVNYWNFLLFDYLDEGSKTFNDVGTFTYFDQLDIGTGSINVTAPEPPVVITLTEPRVSAGNFIFEANGLTVGKMNVLEVSTNLVEWIPVSTNLTVSSPVSFTNSITSGPHCYRVLEQP